jgi:hypothetical protein
MNAINNLVALLIAPGAAPGETQLISEEIFLETAIARASIFNLKFLNEDQTRRSRICRDAPVITIVLQ